jgi:redox-sensitive bicupin YhaK (pirin superfamily)
MPFKIYSVESSPDGLSRNVLARDVADRYDPFLGWHERGAVRGETGSTIGVDDDPQRGCETLDYRFTAERRRSDSHENVGFVWAGGMPWARAASDVTQTDRQAERIVENSGEMRAFQICLRLPHGETSTRQRQREFAAESLPVARSRGSWVRVLAGEFAGERSPVDTACPLFMVHVRLTPRADVAFPLEPGATTLVYAMRGTAQLGPQPIEAGQIGTSRSERSYIALEGGVDGFEGFVLSAVPIGDPAGARGQASINSPQEASRQDAGYCGESVPASAGAD